VASLPRLVRLRESKNLAAKEDCQMAPPLVLEVLQAVHEATKLNHPTLWVSIRELQIEPDPERIGAAIEHAVHSGWLQINGNPVQSVAITQSGIAQIRQD
jgi:hypothetical protein